MGLNRCLVDLTGSATRRQAPAPPWGLVCDPSPLQFLVPCVQVCRRMELDVAVLHELWTLRAGDLVVRRVVDLDGDPLFEAGAAGADEMVAVVGR